MGSKVAMVQGLATGRQGAHGALLIRHQTETDNFNKLWQDARTGIVYEDDSQIGELSPVS
jgi:Holliday junction resolvase RusA-like endonuclease